MGKIIALFNHKGGVGKTTLAYNLGYALANKGKKVLLIDADSQLNLTMSVYGFVDKEPDNQASLFGEKDISELPNYLKKYISIKDLIDSAISSSPIDPEKKIYISEHCHNLRMISGSLESYRLDLDLSTFANTGGDSMKRIFENIQNKITQYITKDGYDFVIIDTSPSAVSMLNAFLVGISDYFIAPATPSLFSKEAIKNLASIFKTWKSEMLVKVLRLPNTPYGMDFKVKFLGICLQMARRMDLGGSNTDGISKAHNKWSEGVKQVMEPFFDIHKSCTKNEFKEIFPDREHCIINKFIDVAGELRSIAECAGKPVIAITQDDCKKHSSSSAINLKNGEHAEAKNMISEQFEWVADRLIKALDKGLL
jgi:cellulose biosynthesis protein BcsQ